LQNSIYQSADDVQFFRAPSFFSPYGSVDGWTGETYVNLILVYNKLLWNTRIWKRWDSCYKLVTKTSRFKEKIVVFY